MLQNMYKILFYFFQFIANLFREATKKENREKKQKKDKNKSSLE